MKDYSDKLIQAKPLENGVTVSLFDLCKPVAADRWYLKIICRLELPVKEDKLVDFGIHGERRVSFDERFKGVLVHEFAKERHFVDEKEIIVSKENDEKIIPDEKEKYMKKLKIIHPILFVIYPFLFLIHHLYILDILFLFFLFYQFTI